MALYDTPTDGLIITERQREYHEGDEEGTIYNSVVCIGGGGGGGAFCLQEHVGSVVTVEASCPLHLVGGGKGRYSAYYPALHRMVLPTLLAPMSTQLKLKNRSNL